MWAPFSIRTMTRSGVTAALLLALLLTTSCSSTPEPEVTQTETEDSPPIAGPTTPAPEPEQGSLIYVDGRTLRSHSLDGKDTLLAKLPSADVAVSPDGTRFVTVREGSGVRSDEEGFVEPRLMMGHTASPAALSEIGPGRSPVWSPDGAFVAVITVAEGHSICADGVDQGEAEEPADDEGCVDGERVTAYPGTGSGPGVSAIGSGTWSIVGWTFDHHIVAASRHNEAVMLGFPGATFEEIQNMPFTPEQVWGVSPTEPTLFVVTQGRKALTTAGSDAASSQTTEVDLPGRPADGGWSPNGQHIAVVAIGGGPDQLFLIDRLTGSATPVPESGGAQGNVVWSADGERFAYVRVDPSSRTSLQAVACSVELRCEELFSWEEGVRLLGLIT